MHPVNPHSFPPPFSSPRPAKAYFCEEKSISEFCMQIQSYQDLDDAAQELAIRLKEDSEEKGWNLAETVEVFFDVAEKEDGYWLLRERFGMPRFKKAVFKQINDFSSRSCIPPPASLPPPALSRVPQNPHSYLTSNQAASPSLGQEEMKNYFLSERGYERLCFQLQTFPFFKEVVKELFIRLKKDAEERGWNLKATAEAFFEIAKTAEVYELLRGQFEVGLVKIKEEVLKQIDEASVSLRIPAALPDVQQNVTPLFTRAQTPPSSSTSPSTAEEILRFFKENNSTYSTEICASVQTDGDIVIELLKRLCRYMQTSHADPSRITNAYFHLYHNSRLFQPLKERMQRCPSFEHVVKAYMIALKKDIDEGQNPLDRFNRISSRVIAVEIEKAPPSSRPRQPELPSNSLSYTTLSSSTASVSSLQVPSNGSSYGAAAAASTSAPTSRSSMNTLFCEMNPDQFESLNRELISSLPKKYCISWEYYIENLFVEKVNVSQLRQYLTVMASSSFFDYFSAHYASCRTRDESLSEKELEEAPLTLEAFHKKLLFIAHKLQIDPLEHLEKANKALQGPGKNALIYFIKEYAALVGPIIQHDPNTLQVHLLELLYQKIYEYELYNPYFLSRIADILFYVPKELEKEILLFRHNLFPDHQNGLVDSLKSVAERLYPEHVHSSHTSHTSHTASFTEIRAFADVLMICGMRYENMRPCHCKTYLDRVIFTNTFCNFIQNTFKPDELISIASAGPGFCLQEFHILYNLIDKGYKNIEIHLVDTPSYLNQKIIDAGGGLMGYAASKSSQVRTYFWPSDTDPAAHYRSFIDEKKYPPPQIILAMDLEGISGRDNIVHREAGAPELRQYITNIWLNNEKFWQEGKPLYMIGTKKGAGRFQTYLDRVDPKEKMVYRYLEGAILSGSPQWCCPLSGRPGDQLPGMTPIEG